MRKTLTMCNIKCDLWRLCACVEERAGMTHFPHCLFCLLPPLPLSFSLSSSLSLPFFFWSLEECPNTPSLMQYACKHTHCWPTHLDILSIYIWISGTWWINCQKVIMKTVKNTFSQAKQSAWEKTSGLFDSLAHNNASACGLTWENEIWRYFWIPFD